MMITDAELGKQIKRLMRLPFAPADEADAKALVAEFRRVLRSGCKSDAHLVAVVDRIVDNSPRVPPPAEVVQACSEVRTSQEGLPDGCVACHGDPFVIGPDGARRCACPRGLALRQMERREKAA